MVPRLRITAVNGAPVRISGDYVLYWMIAARRAGWNFGLQRAVEHATALRKPLMVFEPLRVDHRWASARFHQFVVDGMRDNARAFQDLLTHMNHGGRVAILGIPPKEVAIDWNQVIFKGLVLKGIYGREMFETWYKMISMLQSGLDVSPILTHHFHVDQYEEAFAVMRSGSSGKVVLDW